MMGPDQTERFAELEVRLAEQERVIADLNDMVVSQWRKIDSLERRLAELRDEFESANLGRPAASDPPPPHY